MAITINKNDLGSWRATEAGQTDGNEVIYRLNPLKSTTIEVVFTSAGSGTLKTSLSTQQPTDFTNFTSDVVGAVSANTVWNLAPGLHWIGFDIASGTVTTRLNQV